MVVVAAWAAEMIHFLCFVFPGERLAGQQQVSRGRDLQRGTPRYNHHLVIIPFLGRGASGCLARVRQRGSSSRVPSTARPGQSSEIASSDPNNLTNSPGREKSDILIVIVIFAVRFTSPSHTSRH